MVPNAIVEIARLSNQLLNGIGMLIGAVGILRGTIILAQLVSEYFNIKSVAGTYFKTKIEVQKVTVNEEVMLQDRKTVIFAKWDRDADHMRWVRNKFLVYFSYTDYKGDPCFGHYVTIKGKRIKEPIEIYYHPSITSKYVIDRGERKKDFISTALLLGTAIITIYPSSVFFILFKMIALAICCSLVHDVGV